MASLIHFAFGFVAVASSIAGSIKPESLLLSANGTFKILATPLNAAFGAYVEKVII